MIDRFSIKKGDVSPPLEVQLLRDGIPFVLTGYTVQFIYKGVPSGTKVERDAAITNPTQGLVSYAWVIQDTAAAGLFHVEFRATHIGTGDVTTFPNSGYLDMVVEDTL